MPNHSSLPQQVNSSDGCSHRCWRWGEKSSIAPEQGWRGSVVRGRKEGMLLLYFHRVFRGAACLGEWNRGFWLSFGKGRVFHKALGFSSPSSSCPEHLLGGIQERKDACGLAGEASWRCDWMKSHFPPVTQQATNELWTRNGGKAPTCKLPPCLRSFWPSSPPAPMHPCPAPGRKEPVGICG